MLEIITDPTLITALFAGLVAGLLLLRCRKQ